MLKFCRVAAAAFVFAAATPAFAASVAEEAQALLNQGNAAEALRKVDAHLAKNSQDAEARFVRGLALVKLNRTEQAIRVFADLTRDYPQLPEPYNNLAVLYAQQGDYEKARDALEAALATHPSYGTAHENLGDIYAALAGASYSRAVTLDPNNAALKRKMSLVGQVDNLPSDPGTTVAAPPPARTAAPAAAPVVAVTPAAVETGIDASTAQAINAALANWAQTWSAQNVDGYLAIYAADFVPEGGVSRAAWEGQRRSRITQPKRISVKALSPQLSALADGRVRVSFKQEYESDAFSDSVSKVLEFKSVAGSWKIVREYTR
jgi:tetratricopeptide (TPR) repeat protein